MIKRNKIYIGSVLIVAIIIFAYFLWLEKLQVEIIAVYQRNNYSDVLVRNFPFTDRGKINWWLNNKVILKAKYNIPRPASYGSYTIIFWDFGDGYKEDKYDRLCFDDMKTNKNCIDKEKYMTIYKYNDEDPFFSFDGNRYLINKSGKIVKMKGG